jgi:prepilin peptidase CpaA
MTIVEGARYVVAVAFTLVLAWAAIDDVINRRISNRAVLIGAALAIVWLALSGVPFALGALAAAVIAFAIGYGLWAFKVMGAGDVKLFAVCALVVGMKDLGVLALVTALMGGAIAVASLALRPRHAFVVMAMRGRGLPGHGIPYGVPISAACALIMWARLTGYFAEYLPR